MRWTAVVHALALLIPISMSAQTKAPSLPLGQGRPEIAGIERTTLKDDAKSTVARSLQAGRGRAAAHPSL